MGGFSQPHKHASGMRWENLSMVAYAGTVDILPRCFWRKSIPLLTFHPALTFRLHCSVCLVICVLSSVIWYGHKKWSFWWGSCVVWLSMLWGTLWMLLGNRGSHEQKTSGTVCTDQSAGTRWPKSLLFFSHLGNTDFGQMKYLKNRCWNKLVKADHMSYHQFLELVRTLGGKAAWYFCFKWETQELTSVLFLSVFSWVKLNVLFEAKTLRRSVFQFTEKNSEKIVFILGCCPTNLSSFIFSIMQAKYKISYLYISSFSFCFNHSSD